MDTYEDVFPDPGKGMFLHAPVAACTEFEHPEAQGSDRNPAGRPFYLDLRGGLRVSFRTNTGQGDRTQRCVYCDGDKAGSAMRLTLQTRLGLSPRTREAPPGGVAHDWTPSPLSGARTARLPEGGGASGGHAPASTSAGVSGRAAFPARSPASCVPWSRPPPLPCWIVRQPPPPLPPPPEEWRSREFSATA